MEGGLASIHQIDSHGVDVNGGPGGIMSAVHTDADLERTATAFRATLKLLKEEGDLR